MQVDRGLAVEVRRGGDLELLADLDGELARRPPPTVWPDGQGRGVGGLHSVGLVAAAAAAASLGQLLELLVLGDEVGLGAELEQRTIGEATRPLVADRSAPRLAALAWPLTRRISIGLVEVAVGLGQRLLAVHHPGAGGVAELLHISSGKSLP